MSTASSSKESRTALESQAANQLPPADKVAELFPVIPNLDAASPEEHRRALAELNFGTVFGDHMAVMEWTDQTGWDNRRVEAYGPICLMPSAAVLHYGQEIFEGMKAYRWADGSVWTFRPSFNSARLNHSARRLAMPEVPLEDFLGSIAQTVRVDERWVPSTPDSSLYLRPFVIATEAFLGVRPAKKYSYMMISSPVGPYFKGGLEPVSIWVSTEFHRAAPGGTGSAKTGGNYAASLLPQQLAAAEGFDQVCYLDASSNENLEELGGMNLFVVLDDGTVQTPQLNGSILEGGTRSSIIQLLNDRGIPVQQTTIRLSDLVDGIKSGTIRELFACGTAAVVTPIGKIAGDDFSVTLPGGDLTAQIHAELGGIQRGTVADRHGWMYRLN